MNELQVRRNCPWAEIVFDLYHDVAKYGPELSDGVRVDEVNPRRADRPVRHLVKRARWLRTARC